MKRSIYAFLVILLCVSITYTQDIHWSQLNRNPLFLNPAQTGAFKEDLRLVANYKDQWRSVTIPFSTFFFSLDGKLKNTKNPLSLGVTLVNDQAGDGVFKTLDLNSTCSYLLKFPDSTSNLQFGIAAGLNHRQLNFDKLTFDNQFDGVLYLPNSPTNENFQTDRKTNLTLGCGLVFSKKLNKKHHLVLGLSGHNLNQPNQGFYLEKINRPIRYSTFLNFTQLFSKNVILTYSFLYQKQKSYQEFIVGAYGKYILQKNLYAYKALQFGISTRIKDAFTPAIGLDYNYLSFMLSYDVNYSKLVPASNRRGGLELSLIYVFQQFKPKNVMHRICPDYI